MGVVLHVHVFTFLIDGKIFENANCASIKNDLRGDYQLRVTK